MITLFRGIVFKTAKICISHIWLQLPTIAYPPRVHLINSKVYTHWGFNKCGVTTPPNILTLCVELTNTISILGATFTDYLK